MADFVVYHNPEGMGYELGGSGTGRYGIVTAKRQARNCKGETVWIIQGHGKPRTYTLECRFVVDDVEDISDERFTVHATGEGIPFNPPIPLDGFKWFQRFKEKQNNFSFGFSEIDAETLRELTALTAAHL